MGKKLLIRIDDILPPRKGRYRSGVGRSNFELLKAFSKTEGIDFEIETYCLGFSQPSYKGSDLNFKYHRYVLPHVLNKYCGIESFWRKSIVGYDLFHLTGNFDKVGKREKFVLTIHDMYMYHQSRWNKEMFESCAKNCLGIVTCSNYTKDEIINTLNIPDEKVTVIPWGISQDVFYKRTSEEIGLVKAKYKIQGDYFFACSCSHPRKNAKYIIEGFNKVRKTYPSLSLVLAWGDVPNEILSQYDDGIRNGQIFIIDYVDDNDLSALYSGALASFLVSSLEGFGFPILESMACGTPCITCHNSSLSEIGADKAYYVREKNSDDIAMAIEFFVHNGKNDVEGLISYANSYTWSNTAKKYIEFYKRFL